MLLGGADYLRQMWNWSKQLPLGGAGGAVAGLCAVRVRVGVFTRAKRGERIGKQDHFAQLRGHLLEGERLLAAADRLCTTNSMQAVHR